MADRKGNLYCKKSQNLDDQLLKKQKTKKIIGPIKEVLA